MSVPEHGGTPEQTNAEATEEAIRAIARNGTVGAQHAARVKLRKIAAEADAYRGAVATLDALRVAVADVGDGSAETPWNTDKLVKFAKTTRAAIGGN